MRASAEESCGEHGGQGRVRYSHLKKAARVAADAGTMRIELRESRFGGSPERHGRAQQQRGEKKSCVKRKCGAAATDFVVHDFVHRRWAYSGLCGSCVRMFAISYVE